MDMDANGPAVKIVVSVPKFGDQVFHKPIYLAGGSEDHYTALARALRNSVKADINRILSSAINDGKKRKSENIAPPAKPSKKVKKIIV